jgi:hypothetical protein
MAKTEINWIDIWFEDKQSMLEIMRHNMADDLDAGYDPNGHSIRRQVVDIEDYQAKFDREADMLKNMEPAKAKHWCYIDLKKRGAIA